MRPTARFLALRRLIHPLVALAIFLVSLVVLEAARPRVGFHGDESFWIATSRYFGLIVQADFDNDEWDENYWTLTQPPGYRYVVGAALLLNGYDLNQLNRPYRWSDDLSDNRRKGRVPTNDVLQATRRVSVVFGAGAIAMLYLVGVQLGHPIAGLIGAALLLGSDYSREHFVRAMSESTFALFLLASMGLSLRAFRRGAGQFGRANAVSTGILLGCAMTTKLTGVLSAPALAVCALGNAVLARPASAGWREAVRPLIWAATVGIVAWVLFVGVYPTLWSNPVRMTYTIFEHRNAEIRRQQNHTPKFAVWTRAERPGLVFNHSLGDKTFFNRRLGLPLDVPLAALGVGAVAVTAWRELRGRWLGPSALMLTTIACYAAGITWGFGLNYDRYVMPLFVLGTLMSGRGVEQLGVWLVGGVARVRAAIRPSALPPQGTPMPASASSSHTPTARS
jgi:hypothetical protein